ncbi:MAG TPA: hypothetical protein VFN97_15405 [Actinospica sp.]|nr:hypothetical protein [Actinospica sp.]
MSFDPHSPTEPIPVITVAIRRPKPPVAALLGLGLLALGGAWLMAAPFLLGYRGAGDQPRGAAWTDATRVDVSLGAAILAVAVAALLGYLAAAITWLARYRQAE